MMERAAPSIDLGSVDEAEARAPGATRGRVLLLTSNYPRWEGDATTPFVAHLAGDLKELGWEVDVLAPHAKGAAMDEMLHGVRVERFRYFWPDDYQTVCYGGGALANLRRQPARLIQVPPLILSQWVGVGRRLLGRNYDLLHSHWVLPQGFVGAMWAGLLNIPHVITVHGGDVFALKGRISKVAKTFALASADAITMNSSATESAVHGLVPELKMGQRIHIGVSEHRPDLARANELRRKHRKAAGPLLLFIGRVVAEKGVDDVLDAVGILRQSLPDVSAIIAGDGPDRARLERKCAEKGLDDAVEFTGWVSSERIHDYLAACDIFVGPSKRSPEGWVEAQGLTFAEAMLSGKPVVATRSGGIPDTVRHEETGLLVAESSPAEIAAAVQRLANDSELAGRLSGAGAAFAEKNLTRAASAKAFSELFQRILASPP